MLIPLENAFSIIRSLRGSYFKDFFNYNSVSKASNYSAVLDKCASYVMKDNANPYNKLGQLALKEEAAGKVRVFAMVDGVTQSVLKPLHDFVFSLLSQFPNDATFDQSASVKRCMAKSNKGS
jgi:uncharacterized protein YigE (DUF2233 family)